MPKRHRITKSTWKSRGGLTSPNVARIMRSGRWVYYQIA